jgi:beta-xylosidase
MPYYCNPININYRYQFLKNLRSGAMTISREAADSSMIFYGGRYYIFASMSLEVWVSDDLAHWENHRLSDELPLYDYAPDVRVVDGAVILSVSKRDGVCHFYRMRNPINGPYEKIPGTFPFWDSNLFQDDDGRVYFYWGCSSEMPIYGVELDAKTLSPVGERKILICGDAFTKGYERTGENHSLSPRTLLPAVRLSGHGT